MPNNRRPAVWPKRADVPTERDPPAACVGVAAPDALPIAIPVRAACL